MSVNGESFTNLLHYVMCPHPGFEKLDCFLPMTHLTTDLCGQDSKSRDSTVDDGLSKHMQQIIMGVQVPFDQQYTEPVLVMHQHLGPRLILTHSRSWAHGFFTSATRSIHHNR